MSPLFLILIAFSLRYPEVTKVLIALFFLVLLTVATEGMFLLFLLGIIVVCVILIKIGELIEKSLKSHKNRKLDYKERISDRNLAIEKALEMDPDITVRKGYESEGILPKAYKVNLYKGLTNTNTNKFEDNLISISFKISDDFRGFVVNIRNVSNQKIFINWASSTISDNRVYIDEVPYSDYMSLGKLRPGISVSKMLRERPLLRFFSREDVLCQNMHLTNNAAYVIRIPITLESGKKIRYKFPIVTDRAD